MGNAQRAVPARFDRLAQHRRSMIAKINIGRQQVQGLDEDGYRQLLFQTTGQVSLKECSDPQLAKMIDALKTKGFRPLPAVRAQRPAQHPMARKARALWNSLYLLGAVRNDSERALEAFAQRQLGCEKLVWARQSDAFKLIEALKAMAVRAGWSQVDVTGAPSSVRGLRENLCEAIVANLQDEGAVPEGWSVRTTAFRLCGIEAENGAAFTAEQYDEIARALGAKLREAKGGPR